MSSIVRRKAPRLVAGLAALAATSSLVTLATGSPATADPSSTPAAQDIVGVGADATAALLNRLAADYDATLTAAGDTTSPRLRSWDAGPTGTVIPKTGGAALPRPNGSAAGIAALDATTRATTDFAASSRGPLPTDSSSDDFVAYAQDAVSWAATANGNAPAELSTADLNAIYSCEITNWSQISDIPGYTGPDAAIAAYLPQPESGTRQAFLTAIGSGTPLVPGPCVQSFTPQESRGTDPALQDANSLVPYSVGHWISQVFNGNATPTDTAGPLTVRSVDGLAPVGADNTLNPDFTASPYGRTLYNVLRHAEFTGLDAQGVALRAVFGPAGWVCTSSTAADDIRRHGFLPPAQGSCGSAVSGSATPVPPKAATHKGMTWTVLSQQANGEVHVGKDAATDPYAGDTPASAVLPLLCLTVTGAPAPADITPDFYSGWAKGQIALTRPVSGTLLTSRAAADALCADQFGSATRQAEFHDGYYGPGLATSGGWSFWAYGNLPTTTRFWVAINDQPANPWS